MVQWKGLKPICCGRPRRRLFTLGCICPPPFEGVNGVCPVGVVNMSFPLSDQPVFGEWFVFVEVQGYTYNKSFEVQKYGKDPGTKQTLDKGDGGKVH